MYQYNLKILDIAMRNKITKKRKKGNTYREWGTISVWRTRKRLIRKREKKGRKERKGRKETFTLGSKEFTPVWLRYLSELVIRISWIYDRVKPTERKGSENGGGRGLPEKRTNKD